MTRTLITIVALVGAGSSSRAFAQATPQSLGETLAGPDAAAKLVEPLRVAFPSVGADIWTQVATNHRSDVADAYAAVFSTLTPDELRKVDDALASEGGQILLSHLPALEAARSQAAQAATASIAAEVTQRP